MARRRPATQPDVAPEFAQFYLGETEPYGFYKRVYGESPQAKARRKKAPQEAGGQAKAAASGVSKTNLAETEGGIADEKKSAVDTIDTFLALAKYLSKFPALR
jgi:hypothetical protein